MVLARGGLRVCVRVCGCVGVCARPRRLTAPHAVPLALLSAVYVDWRTLVNWMKNGFAVLALSALLAVGSSKSISWLSM